MADTPAPLLRAESDAGVTIVVRADDAAEVMASPLRTDDGGGVTRPVDANDVAVDDDVDTTVPARTDELAGDSPRGETCPIGDDVGTTEPERTDDVEGDNPRGET